jgi:hypothetical protein
MKENVVWRKAINPDSSLIFLPVFEGHHAGSELTICGRNIA